MLLDLLHSRRSIRQFSTRAVEDEKIATLLEAALLSPSSKGSTPWRFVVVREPERIAQLAAVKPHGAAFLKNAPLVIAVCADTEASDVWVEDCSIATLLLHLQASELGLGSCWVQVRLRPHDKELSAAAYTAELLALPEHIEPLALLGIGYPAEDERPRDRRELLFDTVSSERFGQPWRAQAQERRG